MRSGDVVRHTGASPSYGWAKEVCGKRPFLRTWDSPLLGVGVRIGRCRGEEVVLCNVERVYVPPAVLDDPGREAREDVLVGPLRVAGLDKIDEALQGRGEKEGGV